MSGERHRASESGIIFERLTMIQKSGYQVGQYVRLKPRHGEDAISCICEVRSGAELTNPTVRFRGCWHGVGTSIRRVFQDGQLLLENSQGYVQIARPDEVYH